MTTINPELMGGISAFLGALLLLLSTILKKLSNKISADNDNIGNKIDDLTARVSAVEDWLEVIINNPKSLEDGQHHEK